MLEAATCFRAPASRLLDTNPGNNTHWKPPKNLIAAKEPRSAITFYNKVTWECGNGGRVPLKICNETGELVLTFCSGITKERI